jgi:glycosyltransferase involved in cell wall biosynthesis
LRIAVVKPALARIGGSINTILAFADCFKELGHEVKIVASFQSPRFPVRLINDVEHLIRFYNCRNLSPEDFQWSLTMHMMANNELRDFDVIFTRGMYHGLVKSKIPYIIWTIVQGDLVGGSSRVLEHWTNSFTTLRKLGAGNNICVIIPPHDYSIFRKYGDQEKIYDCVAVLRGNEFRAKGNHIFAEVVKRLNLKGMLITTITSPDIRSKVESLDVPYLANVPKEGVAKILGQSKTMLLPSYDESCPLVIYEALNAKCMPVSRNVGAVKEQLNGLGYVFDSDTELGATLKKALSSTIDTESLIKRGMEFDRTVVKESIRQRLDSLNLEPGL